MVSGDPPGVSGTMIRTGRSGKAWACPGDESRTSTAARSHRVMGRDSEFCAASLPIEAAGIRCPFTKEDPETMLTPEELAQLEGAETLFPSPIPVQCASSDEYMPSPQSARQKEFEARVKQIGAELAKK